MTKSLAYLTLTLCALAIPALAQEVERTAPGQVQSPSSIVVDETPQRVRPPSDGRQVAVLSIALRYDDGALQSAEVLSQERVDSVAPKVFQRQGGDWVVTINGARQRSFFVSDPGWREAEAVPESGDQYTWIPQSGVVEWPLVVPLYANGEALGAQSITIRDTRTGEIILETEIVQR